MPRRAGERGAIDAGALPGLLPLGRPVWEPARAGRGGPGLGRGSLPAEPGRDGGQILAAAAGGDLDALVIAGVDPGDLPDPAAALDALEATPFVVSLELRASAVTDRADVVLPVAAVAEKAGTFVNWEGRPGTFGAVFGVPGVESDLQVLGRIADEMDVHLGLPDAAAARRELAGLGGWPGARDAAARSTAAAGGPGPRAGPGGAGHLASAARHRPDERRRAVPGGHGAPGGGADVGGDRGARPARPTAVRSPCPPPPGRSPSTCGSRPCRTGWCGCRPTRRAARSGASSGPGTAPW